MGFELTEHARFNDIAASYKSDADLTTLAADLREFVNVKELETFVGYNVMPEMMSGPEHVMLYAAMYIHYLETRLDIEHRDNHSDDPSPSKLLKVERPTLTNKPTKNK